MRKKLILNEQGERLAPLYIKKMALGVRHQPHFRVANVLGEFVDRILHSSRSPFGPSKSLLIRSNPNERVLVNEEKDETLPLNIRDATLEDNVDSNEYSGIHKLAKDYSTYELDNIRDLASLTGIERYGILLKFEECRKSLRGLPTEHYLAGMAVAHFAFDRATVE